MSVLNILFQSNFLSLISFNNILYHISGVIVSVLSSGDAYSGIETRSGQAKDYTTGICCVFTKHAYRIKE